LGAKDRPLRTSIQGGIFVSSELSQSNFAISKVSLVHHNLASASGQRKGKLVLVQGFETIFRRPVCKHQHYFHHRPSLLEQAKNLIVTEATRSDNRNEDLKSFDCHHLIHFSVCSTWWYNPCGSVIDGKELWASEDSFICSSRIA
jgi:hypothetical protein